MDINQVKYLSRKVLIFSLAMAAPPAIGGLIYDWVEDPTSGASAIGTIEFADSVNFGDIIDPETQIESFSFNNMVLSDWSLNDVDYSSSWFLDVQENGLDLTYIPPPGYTGAKKKTKVASFNLVRDDAWLSFIGGAKKKTATKDGSNPPIYLSWESEGIFGSYDQGSKKTAQKKVYTTGYGYWDLRGPVPMPEPSTFLLFLAGVTFFSVVYKWLRRLV